MQQWLRTQQDSAALRLYQGTTSRKSWLKMLAILEWYHTDELYESTSDNQFHASQAFKSHHCFDNAQGHRVSMNSVNVAAKARRSKPGQGRHFASANNPPFYAVCDLKVGDRSLSAASHGHTSMQSLIVVLRVIVAETEEQPPSTTTAATIGGEDTRSRSCGKCENFTDLIRYVTTPTPLPSRTSTHHQSGTCKSMLWPSHILPIRISYRFTDRALSDYRTPTPIIMLMNRYERLWSPHRQARFLEKLAWPGHDHCHKVQSLNTIIY